MPARILVVDDDDSIRDALCDYLARHGYAVRGAADGPELDAALLRDAVDLVVLDLMLPGEDGLSICRRLVTRGVPVLMLSALGETADRILGLELGAADYLAKPFAPRELLARVRAVLRRPNEPPQEHSRCLQFAGFKLQLVDNRLDDQSGVPLPLTRNEFRLLRAFAERPQRLLSRERLLLATHGPQVDSFDRAIDLAISRLRRKLAARGGGALIETVRGEGYRLNAAVHRV